MKRFVLILALLAIPFPALAAERISDYRTEVVVTTDSTLHVTETIVYDFGTEPRHGIFRTIPKQSTGGPHTIIEDINVTADGMAVPVDITNSSDEISIKIGDPDRTITGAHTYVIRYSVYNEVRYFTDRDELYWNAIPQNFPVPIDAATAVVSFPAGARLVTSVFCYTGPQGQEDQFDCTNTMDTQGNIVTTADRPLGAYEGMTVAAAIAPGVITRVAPESELNLDLMAYIVGVFVVGVFVVFFVRLARWSYLPRKRSDGGNIIVQYDPPAGISAPEVAYLADPRRINRIFTSAVIQLAIDGWLKMEFSREKKWWGKKLEIKFHRQKPEHPDDPALHQIFDALFIQGADITLTELKAYARLGALPVGSMAASMAPLGTRRGWTEKAGIFGTRRTTALGQEILEHIAGLKIYLAAAEKERLAFHNAPEHSPQTFEKLLPYAVALGVDEPWLESFGDLQYMPEWSTGDVSFAGMAGLSSGLTDLAAGVNSVMNAYASGTSGGGGGGGGGGSSGGGGGGGGGGSW